MDKDFDVEICGMGNNKGNYPGAFTPRIEMIIKETIKFNGHSSDRVLHLFSGKSFIGHERIDLETPEATKRTGVLDFIKEDTRQWEWVILDPPYEIKRKSKIEEYARTSSVAADVVLRRELEKYFNRSTQNVLWLDMCAPLPNGFKRKQLWFLFPGGYHTVRILSWLIKRDILGQEVFNYG